MYYCIICDAEEVKGKNQMCSMCRDFAKKDLEKKCNEIIKKLPNLPDLFLQELRDKILFDTNIDIILMTQK